MRRPMLAGLAAALQLSAWACAAQTPAPASPALAASEAAERILALEVTVNGSNTGTWPLLERQGALYAPRSAFEEWRVQLSPGAPALRFRGADYLPLSGIAGFSAKTDLPSQSLELHFSPESFAPTQLSGAVSSRPPLSPVLPSAFVNYDLNYAATASAGGSAAKDLGLLAEVGVSSAWGVLTSSHLGRNLTQDAGLGQPRSSVRLETTFTRNLPERNQTLRLGDASTRAGLWGRSVYFGGAQWGSNFALTPGFISQPALAVNGISSAPSTVELYVNDVLRQVSSVPAGPFSINDTPALTGGGNARLVVRDLLGRETVITQPFFTSSQLLAPGLSDWSAEAGRLRLDLGSASAHYGQHFASASWRQGLSSALTLEGRAELSPESKTAGLGLVTTLPWGILGKAALAASRGPNLGAGQQWLLGLEQQRLRTSLYLEAQGASASFRQLGQDALTPPVKLQAAGNFSVTTETAGVFGFGLASFSRFDAPRVLSLSASYAIRLSRGSLSLNASRAAAGASGSFLSLTLLLPLEKNRVATASLTQRGSQQDISLGAAQNPGFDESLGWRTLAGRQQGAARAEGGLYYTGRYGRLAGDVSALRGQTAVRLGAQGALVAADGRLFATQRVDDSFAVAEVAGYGDIGVGLGSQMPSRTDAAGAALIPRLMAYQNNAIRIDARELPISAEIGSIEQIAVPAWRSAVKVVFPVRSGRGALLSIVLDDGEAAPAGAVVQIQGDPETFYVARRGAAFVTGLQPASRLSLTWNAQQCQLDAALPGGPAGDIIRLGPLLCKGVAR